jgi:hypothetical protein
MLLQSEIACLHATQFCGSLILHFVVSLPAYFIAFSSFSMMKLQHRDKSLKTHLQDTRIITGAGRSIKQYVLQILLQSSHYLKS